MGRGDNSEDMIAQAEQLEERAATLRSEAARAAAACRRERIENGSVPENIVEALRLAGERGYRRTGGGPGSLPLSERDLSAALDRAFGLKLSDGLLRAYLRELNRLGQISYRRATRAQRGGWHLPS